MTLPWGSQPPVGGSALISLTDTPPHTRKAHKSEREKRERERKKNGAGGGVLQGKGPFPSSVWDPWWNRAAQGAGLLKNRSKVKRALRDFLQSRLGRTVFFLACHLARLVCTLPIIHSRNSQAIPCSSSLGRAVSGKLTLLGRTAMSICETGRASTGPLGAVIHVIWEYTPAADPH